MIMEVNVRPTDDESNLKTFHRLNFQSPYQHLNKLGTTLKSQRFCNMMHNCKELRKSFNIGKREP